MNICGLVSVVFVIGVISVEVFAQTQKQLIEQRDPSVFTSYEQLSPGYILEWAVNWETRKIFFDVWVQTRGFVAFGLSSKGTWDKADVVIGGVIDGNAYFTDRHGVDNRTVPQVDTSQDWEFLEGRENGTHTFLSFSRAFDTCDENDYAINERDAINIVWAYGNSDNPSREWSVNTRNRGVYPVYLLEPHLTPKALKQATFQPGPPPSDLLAERNLQLWTLSTRMKLPPNETVYQCTLHKAPRLPRKHHMVAYNTRIDSEEGKSATHHIIVFRCGVPPGRDAAQMYERLLSYPGQSCYLPEVQLGEIPSPMCNEIFSGYAIGTRILYYPDHVGSPMAESPNEYYMIQTHYDNAARRSDLDIEVHFDVYYTDQLRPYEADMINVGHVTPGVPSILIPPSTPRHLVYGHCSPQCTEKMLPDEGINIFAVLLHTHLSGRKIRVRHFRGEQELPWISADENYDVNFQYMRTLLNEVNVRKGDHIVVECENDNTWTNASVPGGYATKQEMCLVFFLYYNKLDGYGLCGSEITDERYLRRYLGITNSTWDLSQIDGVATSPSNRAGRTITDISDNLVEWTPQLRRQLQYDHQYMPQKSDCILLPLSAVNQGLLSPQDLAQGNLGPFLQGQETGTVRLPTLPTEYRPPQRNCPAPFGNINNAALQRSETTPQPRGLGDLLTNQISSSVLGTNVGGNLGTLNNQIGQNLGGTIGNNLGVLRTVPDPNNSPSLGSSLNNFLRSLGDLSNQLSNRANSWLGQGQTSSLGNILSWDRSSSGGWGKK